MVVLEETLLDRQTSAIISHLDMLKASLEAFSKLTQTHLIEIKYHASEAGSVKLQEIANILEKDITAGYEGLVSTVEKAKTQLKPQRA